MCIDKGIGEEYNKLKGDGSMEIAIPLTITFVVLKLTHIINWSWWWVFSPFWILAIINGIMYGVFGVTRLFFYLKERRHGVINAKRSLEGGEEVVKHPPRKKTKRSKKRIAFCIIGVILLSLSVVVSNVGYQYWEYYEWTVYDTAWGVSVITGLIVTILGSYLWAKEKGRSWKWGALGLIAPVGYLVLMKLQDKRVAKEAPHPAEQQMIPIILPPPSASQPTTDIGEKTGKKRIINFCPECGFKVAEGAAYCSNCGRKLSSVKS